MNMKEVRRIHNLKRMIEKAEEIDKLMRKALAPYEKGTGRVRIP